MPLFSTPTHCSHCNRKVHNFRCCPGCSCMLCSESCLHKHYKLEPSCKVAAAERAEAKAQAAEERREAAAQRAEEQSAFLATPEGDAYSRNKKRQMHLFLIVGGCIAATVVLFPIACCCLGGMSSPTHSRGDSTSPANSLTSDEDFDHTDGVVHVTPTGEKVVHVRGYTNKSGVYVARYDRAAPGNAKPKR